MLNLTVLLEDSARDVPDRVAVACGPARLTYAELDAKASQVAGALAARGIGPGSGITGLVQSTGEWWLQRRSMSRAHVVEYVTQLIWAALSGLLGEAGIVLDPDRPLPAARPGLTVHRTGQARGKAAG